MSTSENDQKRWLRPDEHARGTELSEDECWATLATATVGHLAIRVGAEIDIVPVNFTVNDRAIYFRSAPGDKLAELVAEPTVAFQADGAEATTCWSVLVHGDAERLSDDAVIEASGVLGLKTATTSVKSNFVRIQPRAISGRRYQGAVG
ncbi:MAG: pyridoxamine 5'-phosphate oxidase family protein [Ilumatobacteraceae bacterium]|nr:pyridoxamine 5'-phosphate oxidase family protein [Ilumatobacteraceae bacterium]